MTDFTKIKSKFVKDQLRKLKYSAKNKSYIEDLMKIEQYISNPELYFVSGVKFHGIRPKYNKEVAAIFAELNPKGYKVLLEQDRTVRENVKRWQKEVKEQEQMEKEVSKRTWALMHGKKAKCILASLLKR